MLWGGWEIEVKDFCDDGLAELAKNRSGNPQLQGRNSGLIA
jgi:hypothetical protein